MAVREIPIEQGEAAFLEKIDLDNRPFSLRFTYNVRRAVWTLDISDDNGDVLVVGVPIYVNQDLLKQFRHDARLPQGLLIAANVVDKVSKPDLDNFGGSVVMLYREAS